MGHLHPLKTIIAVCAVVFGLAALLPLLSPLWFAAPYLAELALFVATFVTLRFGAGAFFRLVLRGRTAASALELESFQSIARATECVRARLAVFQHPDKLAFGMGDLGGPTIFVSTGLARGLSPAALRALFAHEFGHVRLLHLDASAALLASFISIKGLLGGGPLLGAVLILLLLIYLAVRRSFELAADRFAVVHAGADAMQDLLRALGDSKPSSRWLKLLSTHPTDEARRGALLGAPKVDDKA